MPGPSSSKVAHTPTRPLRSITPEVRRPPPPWTTVLRASSETAVTNFVWSTSRNPACCASSRTRWRARTTSSSSRSGSPSSGGRFVFLVVVCVGVGRRQEHPHVALHGEGGPDAREREAQVDQRDRHHRAHADHD